VQPGFPAIEHRPISRLVSEARRASIINGEAFKDDRLCGDLDEAATEHLPMFDATGRRDIAVAVDLVKIQVLDLVEPLQTHLLLQQENVG
jgi:hypothetical protein